VILLDGFQTAEKIKSAVKSKIGTLQKKPSLHVVVVGNYPPSLLYIEKKRQACMNVGIQSTIHTVDENVSTEALSHFIKTLNDSPEVDAILLQLPLPSGINQQSVINMINPSKDVDGLTSINLGKLIQGNPHIIPCTPQGCIQLINQVHSDISGMHAVVIGRSILVGKPMAHLLLNQQATVTICHSQTKNLKSITQSADILVVAIGNPQFINRSFVKKNTTIIDVGISYLGDKIEGDVNFEDVRNHVHAISPVPKGVGPVTVANLLINTLKCANIDCHDILKNI
jgi:methylenetetrahydrofolate dehydrogenase (NADP+)/methenyltetrahydrofolate cyclohydrolase